MIHPKRLRELMFWRKFKRLNSSDSLGNNREFAGMAPRWRRIIGYNWRDPLEAIEK